MVTSGADPGFAGTETFTILGALLRKRISNYGYKIRYESENLGPLPGHWKGFVKSEEP